MRVLLSFVGKRDPLAEDNTEGAIATLTRVVRPDLVVLFPTARIPEAPGEETESYAEMVRDWLKQELGLPGDRVYTVPVVVRDPRDYGALLRFLRERLPETSDADELCVNLSSGTPQMQTAWLVAGSAGLLARARYFQVSRPLPRPHRPDERVEAVDTNFLREDALIRQLHQAVRGALFVVAARCAAELAAVAVTPSRAAVAEKVIAPLMEAYTAWDLLDYPRALHRVRQVRERATGWRETVHLAGTLAEQERVLGQLARQQQETWPGLVDIWYNGVRCRQRGAHADCLARFYRLQEGCLYLRLREHGVEPRRLAESRYQGEPVATLLAQGRNVFGSQQAEEVLLELDPGAKQALHREVELALEAGIRLGTLKSLGQTLREIRNASLVGHNMRPISSEESLLAVEVGRHLLLALGGEAVGRLVDEYPLAPARLEEVLEAVRRA